MQIILSFLLDAQLSFLFILHAASQAGVDFAANEEATDDHNLESFNGHHGGKFISVVCESFSIQTFVVLTFSTICWPYHWHF